MMHYFTLSTRKWNIIFPFFFHLVARKKAIGIVPHKSRRGKEVNLSLVELIVDKTSCGAMRGRTVNSSCSGECAIVGIISAGNRYTCYSGSYLFPIKTY